MVASFPIDTMHFRRLGHVVDLAFGELDLRRVPETVHESMTLSGGASSRVSDALRAVFFPPAAS